MTSEVTQGGQLDVHRQDDVLPAYRARHASMGKVPLDHRRQGVCRHSDVQRIKVQRRHVVSVRRVTMRRRHGRRVQHFRHN